MWFSTMWELGADGHFSRKERGALDFKNCDLGEFCLEILYTGRWKLHGNSGWVNGLSLASVDMSLVSLTLLQGEVCEGDDGLGQRRVCRSVLPVMQENCPCNNLDWRNNVQRTRGDIVQACMPQEQCSLLNRVYVKEKHFFSYRATVDQVCLSAPSLSSAQGWRSPQDN